MDRPISVEMKYEISEIEGRGVSNESAAHLQTLLAGDGGNRVDSIVSDVGVAAESLANLATGLDETRGRLDPLPTCVDGMVAKQSPRVDASFHDLENSLDTLARHTEAISHKLKDTSRNLNEWSAQLRRDPAVMVYGPAKQEQQ
jgi:phospholipid/cholesterol/gamma-HCH transport system substrate-binding protein